MNFLLKLFFNLQLFDLTWYLKNFRMKFFFIKFKNTLGLLLIIIKKIPIISQQIYVSLEVYTFSFPQFMAYLIVYDKDLLDPW